MGLSIKDPETERLVRELSERRGTGITQTIKEMARAKLLLGPVSRGDDEWWATLKGIQSRSRAMPVLDHRSAEEIAGYDPNGAPA